MNGPKPGEPCPFAGGECQDGCWAWNHPEAPGRCWAVDFPEEGQSPKDYYNEAIIGVIEGC